MTRSAPHPKAARTRSHAVARARLIALSAIALSVASPVVRSTTEARAAIALSADAPGVGRRPPAATPLSRGAAASSPSRVLDPRVSAAAYAALPAPLTDADFRAVDPARVALGQLLFHDPLLSGNRNIACASCHHATLASADGTSLGLGEGGRGLGPERTLDAARESVKHRVPRHSPALFNLGAHEFTILFHDGRVSVDPDEPGGHDTPAEEYLPEGLPSVLAAQALFPFLAEVEMAGAPEANEIAGAAARRIDYGWRALEARLRESPAYLPHFTRAWPDVATMADVSIVHVAHALDDFVNAEWRATGSPFDAWLAGDAAALDDEAAAGLELFHTTAGCATCHSGALQTDHGFHALMLPPFGPGRTRAFDDVARDTGRMNVTDDPADAYRFRTPSLRNVARTAPYGHNGAYATLEGIVRHHLDPHGSLARWDRRQLVLFDEPRLNAADFLVEQDAREMARYRRHLDIEPVALDDEEVDQLIAFLHALTDEASIGGRLGVPASVPSGLPVD